MYVLRKMNLVRPIILKRLWTLFQQTISFLIFDISLFRDFDRPLPLPPPPPLPPLFPFCCLLPLPSVLRILLEDSPAFFLRISSLRIRLMLIAFREMLPKNVWEAVTQLSLFFKTLTATSITIEDMERLESNIPTILCKLETIFIPGVFNSMEHLPVHLPYEARIGGPVKNRWIYQFERFLNQLKKDSKVEGSIVNAYLLREAANFCSYYFEPNVLTRNRNVHRNDDRGDDRGDYDNEILKIFSYPGREYGKLKKRMLTDKEFNAVHTYILLNEDQMQTYIDEYEKLLKDIYPNINRHDLAVEVDKYFATWFENHVLVKLVLLLIFAFGKWSYILLCCPEKEIKNKYIYDLSRRPLRSAKSYKVYVEVKILEPTVYFINGYKFHTDAHCENKASMNSEVCICSEVGDYYGKNLEIFEVEYPGFPRKTTFVFKYDWYDPTANVGVKVHKQYNLVDINLKRKFNKFESFVLAMQPTQVCCEPYPNLKQIDHQKDVAFQDDEVIESEIISNTTEAFEYDDSSSNGSDDDVEGDFDDANKSGNDGIANSGDSFEYSTSDNEEDVEEEDEFTIVISTTTNVFEIYGLCNTNLFLFIYLCVKFFDGISFSSK
ncbi:hypothetical protein LXL04_028768 [Taraxacum kok-saghyz]